MFTKSLSAFFPTLETKFYCLSRPAPQFVLGANLHLFFFLKVLHLKEKLHHPSAFSVSPHYRIFFKRALISPILGKPLFTDHHILLSLSPPFYSLCSKLSWKSLGRHTLLVLLELHQLPFLSLLCLPKLFSWISRSCSVLIPFCFLPLTLP